MLGDAAVPVTAGRYVPRGRNGLHTIFDSHFQDFCEQYDEKYAVKYGKFRLERIQQTGDQIIAQLDKLDPIARAQVVKYVADQEFGRVT